MRFTTIILAAIPALTSSAWELKLFQGFNQGGDIIFESSGRADHDCRNLPSAARNRARSYDWSATGILGDKCEVFLYRDPGCNRLLFGSGEHDNHDNLSGQSDKNIESYKVEC